MQPNTKKYLPLVEGLSISREEKEQLIRDVIAIMQAFVDRAYGLDPVQRSRGYLDVSDLQNQNSSMDSKSITTSAFRCAANENQPASAGERSSYGN